MLINYFQDVLLEAGCDEAGRGCLAGDLFAAAVVLPKDFSHPLLNDSKQMTERRRNLLREVIEREAVAWSVARVDARRIDRINILNASFEGMSVAASNLKVTPDLLIIDGNRFKTTLNIPYHCVVGGDAIYSHVAAASVLAKTYRDEYMKRLDDRYPVYGWCRNKGYPTGEHRLAIIEHGVCEHHRKTFCGCADPGLW